MVSTTQYGRFYSSTGTLAEVMAELTANGVLPHKVINIYYDSGAAVTTAVYYDVTK